MHLNNIYDEKKSKNVQIFQFVVSCRIFVKRSNVRTRIERPFRVRFNEKLTVLRWFFETNN